MFVAELCKGSTADSDSVCLGSNPSSAAKKSDKFRLVGFFYPSRQAWYIINTALPGCISPHLQVCISSRLQACILPAW